MKPLHEPWEMEARPRRQSRLPSRRRTSSRGRVATYMRESSQREARGGSRKHGDGLTRLVDVSVHRHAPRSTPRMKVA